jgi:hypothetical protein
MTKGLEQIQQQASLKLLLGPQIVLGGIFSEAALEVNFGALGSLC